MKSSLRPAWIQEHAIGVKKCAEIVFKKGQMVKGIGLAVLEEKMKALDPSRNENYRFLGCEQADKINLK